MRAVTAVDGFEIVVDEPAAHGGSGTGPQPTDLLLASVGSCLAMSSPAGVASSCRTWT
jgi:putative redox protein